MPGKYYHYARKYHYAGVMREALDMALCRNFARLIWLTGPIEVSALKSLLQNHFTQVLV